MAEEKFKAVEEEYQRLKTMLEQGRIDAEHMKAELKKLLVQDEQGRYWMVGGRSGEWYLHENGQWRRTDPPRAAVEAITVETQVRAEPVSLEDPPQAAPAREEIRPQADKKFVPQPPLRRQTVQTASESPRSLLIKSFSPWSLLFFLGGLGLVIGVIWGALFGIFPILNELLEYFPQMIRDTRGKLAGGLIFAFLGGLAGFISAGLAGFLLALLYNVNAFIFGGIRIRTRS